MLDLGGSFYVKNSINRRFQSPVCFSKSSDLVYAVVIHLFVPSAVWEIRPEAERSLIALVQVAFESESAFAICVRFTDPVFSA